jgi:diguanylate cyclase (GGDEF)-like protein
VLTHRADTDQKPDAPLGSSRLAFLGLTLLTLGLAGAVAVASATGLFRPVDNALTDYRFRLANEAPTGSIVLVEIDPASLREVGVWPWPRHVYADLLDRLMAHGAAETVFDIDFSSASTDSEDQTLADALDRAGGYAYLAAFQQFSPVADQLEVSLPLQRFRAAADAAVVNVVGEQDGVVRRYPPGLMANGKSYKSAAEVLSGQTLPDSQPVFIDYGIDASAIDRISVADVLSGKVDAHRLAGKQVVVAASAQELRDIFTVPRFGPMPGGMLQILASETLKQHRQLHATGWATPAAIAGGLALLFVLFYSAAPLWMVVAGGIAGAVLIEIVAYALQARFGLLLPTAPIVAMLAALVALAVLQELARKRRQHLAAARERDAMRQILDRVVADNFDGVMVVDEAGIVIAASGMAERLLAGGGDLVGRYATAVLPDGLYTGMAQALAESEDGARSIAPSEVTLELGGERRSFEFVVTRSTMALADGINRHVICLTFRDISERRRNEERLAYLARHDPLTGALSRLPFVQAVEAALKGDDARAEGLTLLMLDLGRFRLVNDTLGHAFGDRVMREVAARLDGLDLLAVGRVGGDSFAVARRGVLDPDAATAFGAMVIERIVEPYVLEGRRAVLSANAGLADTRRSGFSGDALLSHADMALSSAQAAAGNAVTLFTPDMLTKVSERQELEAALRQAIADGEIQIFYQPQVRLDTGELAGVEALMRWRHPILGDVSPGRFMPLAEETGLIVELGRFALDTACREVASWPSALRLAVNISPVQFALADVARDVRMALLNSGLPPERLDLEITEGVFMAEGHPATQALASIRQTGVGVAIDDFGTGYSSLSYLSRLPIDKLKIDQSFVRNLSSSGEGLAVVKAVLTLAQDLGKVTVAEGVENEAQATLLRQLGCDIAQGYHYGKAIPASELRARNFTLRRKLALVR